MMFAQKPASGAPCLDFLKIDWRSDLNAARSSALKS
jgi:hypothetical protein